MTINDVIEQVISGINTEWTTLEKIRYVYVTVGKVLQKDTDFFFSVDNKLAEKNLSLKEIKDIYEDEKNEGDLKVICRSAAYILQRIYDRLDIKSELIKSNNNVINYSNEDGDVIIHHWFLAVYDENNAYFLTLASDLPYIQMGMQTRHFASNIPYKKVQKNGEEINVYFGPEIKHTVLGDKELRAIDQKIGYIDGIYAYDDDYRPSKDYQLNYNDAGLVMLTQDLKSNKLYMEMEQQSTRFYNRLIEIENKYGEKNFIYEVCADNVKDINWDNWIRRLCKYVQKRLESIIEYKIFLSSDFYLPTWNYDTWIHEVCLQMQRYLYQFVPNTDESLYIQDEFKYSKWSRQMKNAIKDTYDGYEVDNTLMILDKCNVLVSGLRVGHPNPNFMHIFNSLSYHFISKGNLLETSMVNDVVSSRYITHKFKRLFKRVFGCNKEIRDLNKMDYSEQIVVIKMVIDKMFPELTRVNSGMDETFNNNYSVVQNRIQIYSVKNIEDGNYSLVFHILGDSTYDDTYYFYNPKLNTFEVANILEIYENYIIVSDRFKTRIEEMEDIETEKKNKR